MSLGNRRAIVSAASFGDRGAREGRCPRAPIYRPTRESLRRNLRIARSSGQARRGGERETRHRLRDDANGGGLRGSRELPRPHVLRRRRRRARLVPLRRRRTGRGAALRIRRARDRERPLVHRGALVQATARGRSRGPGHDREGREHHDRHRRARHALPRGDEGGDPRAPTCRFARAMRDGAIHRFGWVEGRITSAMVHVLSAIAS